MSGRGPVLRIENGSFSHGAKKIFSNVSFAVDNAKIALVGDNGVGKSTILKCLVGIEHLNDGEIVKSRGLRISYLPQEVPKEFLPVPVRKVYEEKLEQANRHDEMWMVETLLSELNIAFEDWDKPLGQFSGGWQRILLVASAISLENPDIIIMDEPTNHLDISNIYRLETLLNDSARVPLLIVSHDREFLDKVTNKTIFLRQDGAHVFKAPFSRAREELAQIDLANAQRREMEEKEVARLKQVAHRYKQWGVLNSDFHKKMKATEKRIERIENNLTESFTKKDRALNMQDGEMDANVALRLIDHVVTVPDGSRVLYKIDKLIVKTGDRIALLGENGVGKSMLLTALHKSYQPDNPHYDSLSSVRFNPQTKLQYFDQKISVLPDDDTLIQYLCSQSGLARNPAIACLASAGFPYERIDDPIKKLSFGEKSRLLFTTMNLTKPNFYLLDEPTNHLDIEGQEKLEENLENAAVSCIFVSHDRYFTRVAANRYIEIKKGKLTELDSPEEFFERQKSA
jgi:ATPase subunit of ABC transporter with duplicated ATPase domains